MESTPQSDVRRYNLTSAALLVMGGFVASRLLGLLRDAIIAARFGSGAAFEAYVAASRPPETIFFIVAGGALASAFIPTYTDYLTKADRADQWRFVSAVIATVSLLLLAISALSAVFAPHIVALVLAPEFDVDKQRLTVQLMRIMLLTPAVFGVSGLLMGLLNANGRFLLPALAPAFYNLGIIFGAVALTDSLGVYGLAWGAVIGALLHLAVQIPGLVRLAPLPRLSLRHPGLRSVFTLMGPRVLGLAVVQVNFWVNINLASGMVEGSVAALQRGFMVMLLPLGVVAQSVATAVFPAFAAQASVGRTDELRRTFTQVAQMILFLSLPASIGLVMLRVPVVRVLFERGEFSAVDTQAAARALLFYGVGLVGHALVEVLTRAFYAMQDTRTPVAVGGGAMLLNVVLSLALIRVIGSPQSLVNGAFAGLALANSLATGIEAAVLFTLLIPRLGGLDTRSLIVSLGQTLIASTVMAVSLAGGQFMLGGAGALLTLAVLIPLGGAVFLGSAWLMRSAEAAHLVSLARRRVSL